MSIRLKTATVILASNLVLLAITYVLGFKLLIKDYLVIEKQLVSDSLDRVHEALDNEIEQLDIKLADWAQWDDTYKFIRDKNKEYINSNLTNESLQNLKLSAMLFYDEKGTLQYSKFHPDIRIAAEDLKQQISSYERLIGYSGKNKPVAGFLKVSDRTFIIASREILSSLGDSPSRGYLVFVKSFTDDNRKNLEKLIRSSIHIYPYDSLHSKTLEARKNFLSRNNYYITALGNTINGYSLVNDVNNKPIFIFETKSDRVIYTQGKHTILSFIVLLGVFGFTLSIIMFVVIGKMVVMKVSKLSRQAKNIGESNDLSQRVEIQGADEISMLAKSINNMLDALRNSEEIREDALRKNESMSKELKAHIEELEHTNKLMVGRELKMIELKKSLQEVQSRLKQLEDKSKKMKRS